MSDSVSKFFENHAHWTDYINTNNMNKERKYENTLHWILGKLDRATMPTEGDVKSIVKKINEVLEEEEPPKTVIRG